MLQSSIRASESDKRRMLDRIAKLEDELRLLRMANGLDIVFILLETKPKINNFIQIFYYIFIKLYVLVYTCSGNLAEMSMTNYLYI